MSEPLPIVTFLTDFGHSDIYVGVVKGVMLSMCPDLRVVDLTHEIPPQDVQEGAFQLLAAVPHLPIGSIHLAVVDPGVGTERQAVAVRVGGHTFVGPDNGLLSWVVGHLQQDGDHLPTNGEAILPLRSPSRAVELTEPRFWRHPVAPTFHARDVFGPIAAHLAGGRWLEALGRPLSELVNLPFPEPQPHDRGGWRATIIQVDRFGNLTTSLPGRDVPASPIIQAGTHTIQGIQRAYGERRSDSAADAAIALIGSAGFLEIAVPGGNASQHLGLHRGDVVEVTPGPQGA